MGDLFSQAMASESFRYAGTLLTGILIGYFLCRFILINNKPSVYAKLDKAQNHLAQDILSLKKSIKSAAKTAADCASDMDDIRQEIEQIENDHHVRDILNEARTTVIKLKDGDDELLTAS